MMLSSNKTGKIILMLLNQELSAFNASFSLAKKLLSIGYHVIYVVYPCFETYVSKHNFECEVILKDIWPDSNSNIKKSLYSKGVNTYLDLKMLETSELERIFSKEPISLVIVDQINWYLSVPFLKRGIPLIGFSTCLASAWDWLTPPVFSEIVPNRAFQLFEQMQCAYAWAKLCLYKSSDCGNFDVFRLLIAEFLNLSPSIVVNFLRKLLRKENPFSGIYTTQVVFKQLIHKYGGSIRYGEYGYRLDVPELVACSIEFDFPGAQRRRLRYYLGACVDTQRNDGQFPWSRQEEFRVSLPELDKINTERKVIYCSLGSHAESPMFKDKRMRLFTALIDGIKERPYLQLIIQINCEADINYLKKFLPDNITLVRWVPQLEILSHCHLFITHGGLSSIREAIYFAVPMLVFPICNDGYGNAARVDYHKLGLRGNIKKVTPKGVGNLVDKIFDAYNLFKESSLEMSLKFRDQSNSGIVVDFVSEFIKSHRYNEFS